MLRLPVAVRNPLSLIGMALATVMAMLFLGLVLLEIFGWLVNPYIGLVIYFTVPVLFVVGLLLIPIGGWWTSRRQRLHPELPPPDWPTIDLRQPHQRRVLVGVLALTVVNLMIVSMAAYGGVHYMETTEFCGQVCHVTMEPEYSAHQVWPHAQVTCVSCHVGSGAGALVESKINGTRQLALLWMGRQSRPVPTPVEQLRSSRETCQQCHWSGQFHGDKIRVVREYASDEMNSETATTLRLHVGGDSGGPAGSRSIHWHNNPANQIEYVSDPKRETIPYVKLTDGSGRVSEYVVAGTTPEQIAAGTRRTMDCVDCHNRPAHTFFTSPERAVDGAIARGAIPRNLPFARREAVAAVGAEYADKTGALEGIAQRLREFYRTQPGADARLVEQAVAASQDAWARNVFPAMKVTWGTYPSQIGHLDTPGCFRCHDDEHKTSDGRVISQDCELCHTIE